jgi:glycosyltransferase involved in cell wall biosynthesis
MARETAFVAQKRQSRRRPADHHRVDPRRVALYNGVFVRHDAISDSLRYKLDILEALAGAGVPVAPVVFTHHSDSAAYPGRGTFEVLTAPDFWRADLHWYEFGIAYDLFNTVFTVPAGRPVLGTYHNVTPLALVTDPDSRLAVRRSAVQRHNLARADHVACDSEFNRHDLLAIGIAPERLSVLALPPAVAPPETPRRFQEDHPPGDSVRLLFVGRFVRSKGLVDLIEAVVQARRRGAAPFHLTLVGNPAFADPPTLNELEALRRRHDLDSLVSIAGAVDDTELSRLYRNSDALVLPSYHEGYCVPVIEALAHGCYVITSDAGNLPAIAGGLGTLVATGDVAALAGAIETFVAAVHAARSTSRPAVLPAERGPTPEPQWRALVAAHLGHHSLANYRRGVLDLLARYLPDLAEHPAWDAAANALVADNALLR